MKTKGNQKKEGKSVSGWFYGIFNVQTNAGGYCTPDQCFINSHQTFSSTNLISPFNSGLGTQHIEPNGKNPISDIFYDNKLVGLFPPHLVEIITDAAQRGFLISMLITLANEGATDYLKGLHYHPDKIYWINQSIRALLIIALGSSVPIAIASPLAGYMLYSYFGVSKENSNYITTGLALGANLFINPMNLIDTTAAIGASLSASLLAGKITKYGYTLVRDAFFISNEVENSIENNHHATIELLS